MGRQRNPEKKFSAFPRLVEFPDEYDRAGDDGGAEDADAGEAEDELAVCGLLGLTGGGFGLFRG